MNAKDILDRMQDHETDKDEADELLRTYIVMVCRQPLPEIRKYGQDIVLAHFHKVKHECKCR